VPRPFYERSWTAPLHRKVGLKSTNELIRINSGATKARMLTFMLMSGPGVRRDKAALSSGCKSHPAIAPAGSSRSSYGGDEIAEAFGMRVTNW
jgi:hypothetical protein